MKPSRRGSAIAAIIAAALLTGCASSPPATQANTVTAAPQPSLTLPSRILTPTSSPTPTPTPRPSGPPAALPVAPGAAALPQTRTLPSTLWTRTRGWSG
jgi:hypothetical protein